MSFANLLVYEIVDYQGRAQLFVVNRRFGADVNGWNTGIIVCVMMGLSFLYVLRLLRSL